MRKLYLFIIVSLAIALGISASPAKAFYDNYPQENAQFHPQNPDYYDGNKRLELKKRADIERASAPNVHYDKYEGDYYTCSWKRNPNLGTWVCDKSYSKTAEEINVCPYGSILSPSGTCSKINIPANAHLNAAGNGWECYAGYKYVGSGCVLNQPSASVYKNTVAVNSVSSVNKGSYTAYVYYYGDDNSANPTKITQVGINRPVSLPSTGSGIEWMLISGAVGTLGYVLKRKLF